ncbi:MAG: hypothetical protein QW705_02595 [Zestosphaera sp.]
MFRTVNDEVFFNHVELRLHKTLSPSLVGRLSDLVARTFTDFLASLQDLDISSCMAREIHGESPLPRPTIYSRLLRCWEGFVRDEIRLIKPSDSVSRLINLHVGRYVLNDLAGVLSAGSEDVVYLSPQTARTLRGVAEVDGLLPVLRGYVGADFIVKTLRKYRGFRVGDLDIHKLVGELIESYFRELRIALEALGVSTRALECVGCVERFEGLKHSLRRALREGRDLASVLTPLTPTQRGVLANSSSDTHALEFLLAAFPTILCHNLLRTAPPSAETLLHYILLKDWELRTFSQVIYLITSGYPVDVIQEEVAGWVRFYESLPK